MRIREAVEKKKNEKAKEGYVPYIEIGDIDLETKMYSLKEKSAVSGAVMACKGDILVSTVRPSRGAVTTVQEEMSAVSSAFTILRPNLEVCIPKYLFYCVCSKPFLQHLGANSKGATYPTCSKDDVLDYDFNILGADRQLDAVNKLDRLYSIIIKRKRQISLLDDLIKARFVEMFGDPETSEKYPHVAVKEITEVISGGTPDRKNNAYWENGTVPWVKTTELQNNRLSDIGEYITEKGLNESSAKIVPEGTVLIAMYGQGKTRGMTAILDVPASTNQACACLLPSEKIESEYLWQYMIMSYDRLRNLAQGGNQPNLNGNMIKNFTVLIPSKDKQIEFVEFVKQVDKSKVVIKQELEKNQLLFDSLMQEYFG